MGKYISVGIGISTKKDSLIAAKEAARDAVKKCGHKPTISFIFFTGDMNPVAVSKGAGIMLGDSEYVGGSGGNIFYNDTVLKTGVMAVSVHSDYLHVGIASVENVSKNQYKAGQQVIKEALKKVPIDKYVDPYLQFNRMKNTDVSWMIKVPSFYTMLFTRGLKLDSMSNEFLVIKGISDVIGLQAPLWGGSFGTDPMKVLKGEPYDIYMFHKDKQLKDGIIALVNVSSLLYSYSLEHGCKPTKTIGFISKVSNNGFVIDEISGIPVVDWYAEKLDIPREEFEKNARFLTQINPLGIPDDLDNYQIYGGGIPVKSSLAYTVPVKVGWPVVIMKGNADSLFGASKLIKKDFSNYVGSDKKPSVALVTQCVTRGLVFGNKAKKELSMLRKELGSDIVGFTCFGETGSKQGRAASFHNVCLNVFALYDMLLSKL